jgi:hypothetical protein
MRLMVAAILCAAWFGLSGTVRAAGDTPPIPKERLDKRVSIDEAEAAHPGISDDRRWSSPEATKPFGFLHRNWEDFKAAILPGDELWTFASPAHTWEDLAGMAGIALVRNGTPIKIITTVMN